jgi:hypothetical protein
MATRRNPVRATEADRVNIRTTMPLPYVAFHPMPAPSRRVRVADHLHITLAAADKLLYGETAINLRYAEVVASDLRAGDHEALAQWVAPAEGAAMGADIPSLMDALCECDVTDATEDVQQAALRHKPAEQWTDLELQAYGRALAKDLYRGTRLLAAIQREQRERRVR